jgi:hypothetical protein
LNQCAIFAAHRITGHLSFMPSCPRCRAMLRAPA